MFAQLVIVVLENYIDQGKSLKHNKTTSWFGLFISKLTKININDCLSYFGMINQITIA